MTDLRPILRDSLWPVPVVVVVAAWFGGLTAAAGAALAAALAVANVAAGGWLVARVALAVADGRDPGLAGAILALKLVLLLSAFLTLMWAIGPLPVAAGLAAVVMGLSIRPFVDLISAPADLVDVAQES